MMTPMALSIVALTVSIASLGWAIYIGSRDRGRLKAYCKAYGDTASGGITHLEIRAVNHGRRPIILTMLVHSLSGGSWSGDHIENIRLCENEIHKIKLTYEDLYHFYPDEMEDEQMTVDLYLEDTLCRRFKVKDAKKNIRMLMKK